MSAKLEPQHRFLYPCRVEFSDTDAAGIMHFSNFFRFMEVAEHAFFRSLGFSVHPAGNDNQKAHLQVAWPRIHASADYKFPLRFEDRVEVELLIEDIRNRVIKYFFRFWKEPDSEAETLLVATGRLTVISVEFAVTESGMKPVHIPDELRQKIEIASPELLNGKAAS